MNDRQERQRVKSAIDCTLSSMTGDPFLPTRVMARLNQEKEGKSMKRNHKFLIVIALVAMLSMTVAVAGELFSGTVDWDGNMIPEEPSVSYPTSTPVPEGAEGQLDRQMQMMEFQAAHPAGDGEQMHFYDLTVRYTPQGSNSVLRTVKDMDAFAEMMAEAPYFPLPASIPEGYRFVDGYVVYGCKVDGEFRLVETVDSDDGFRAERYVLDDENLVVIGYSLDFVKETEAYDPDNPQTWAMVWVCASLVEHVEDTEMYVRNSIDVSAVTVPGMTKAVAIRGAERNELMMYCDLAQPVSYRYSSFHDVASDSQIDITVWSDASMEETIALFGGK